VLQDTLKDNVTECRALFDSSTGTGHSPLGEKTMMKIGATIVGLLVCFSVPVFAQLSKDAAIAKAEAIFKALQDGRTADVVKEFDAGMAQEVPEAKLQPAWAGLVGKFGAFKSITERREGQMEGRQAVELILAFERETIVQRTVFDKDGKISGLVFRPLNLAVLPPNK
jgi:hypothetical protein